MRKKSVSKKAATKGKGRLKKGYRYLQGGKIVKAKSKTKAKAKKCHKGHGKRGRR